MNRMDSKAAVQNVVYGRIKIIQKHREKIKKAEIQDTDTELIRLHRALEMSQKQLSAMYDKAKKEVGENGAAIFEAHKMLLEDRSYIGVIENIIVKQKVNSEYAVSEATEKVADVFAQMSDEYFRERIEDVRAVSEKLIDNLLGIDEKIAGWDGDRILVTDELTVSEVVHLGKEKIKAIVMVHGTDKSHAVILAEMLGIPVMTEKEIHPEQLEDGMEVILYPNERRIILEPAAEEKKKALEQIQEYDKSRALLRRFRDKEAKTKSGKSIALYANIGSADEADAALENGAQGIGLFRSEFIFLGREEAPNEEEQFEIYRKVVQKMHGQKVVIRTLDVGSDKEVPYLPMYEEYNPALGYRGIRISLQNTKLFRTQLRALLRAAYYGPVCIMYPMIISTEEVMKIKEIMEQVKSELKQEEISFGNVEEGIMIETPAAVMVSDQLAEMVDFFSIGTNDLTQYTLALDRQNENLDEFLDPHHPAILRMIKMVSENAGKAGIRCGICGQLASDFALTEEFIKMGINELSIPPQFILPLKQLICEMK